MKPVKDVHKPESCYQGYVTSPLAAPITRSPVFCTTFCTPIKERHKPIYTQKIHPLEYGQVVVPEYMSYNVLSPSKEHPICQCNYYGFLGSMESDGMLLLMDRLYTIMVGPVLMSILSVMITQP